MSRLSRLLLGLVFLLGVAHPVAAQAGTTDPGPGPTEPSQTEPTEGAAPTPAATDAEAVEAEAADAEAAEEAAAVAAAIRDSAAARLTSTQAIDLIRSVFPGLDGNRAIAIARCESGLRNDVVGGPNSNGTYDWGLFQFNDGGTLQSTLNKLGYPGTLQQQRSWALDGPLGARMAATLRNERGWGPWWCAWKLGIVNGKWSSEPGPKWNGYDVNGLPLAEIPVSEDMSRYVAQTYRDVLRREPDAAGLAGWNNSLRSGQIDRTGFADGMVYSVESSMLHAGDLYREILEREPDLKGQQGWASEIAAKRLSLKDARAVYWASGERFQLSGATNREWVTDLYQMELRRNPEPTGLNGWVSALDSGTRNRTQVAQAFVDCPECATKAVTRAYQEYLRRSPDPAGLAGWVSIYPRSDYLILTTHFIASEEYYKRTNS